MGLMTLLNLIGAGGGGGGGGRTTVPFQYAWRFHYGDDPSSPPGSGPGTAVWTRSLANYSICDGVEHSTNRFSLKDCRIACSYDPNCLVWQAFPIEHGRSCYQAYTGMNVTCTPPTPNQKPTFMDGGARDAPPNPAFRIDYSFATADATSPVDDQWTVVDAPHDFIAEYGNFTEDQSDQHHGYLPRNASWYRKHFYLPAAWKADGGATYVHFEGVFHHATVFLNGKYLMSHENGYLGFDVRLDNASGVRHGPGAQNVLSLRADASFGSGHWYEGGGIYRPVHLIHLPPTHITQNGLFVPPESDGTVIAASAELETAAVASQSAVVRFSLFELAATGGSTPLATATSAATTVPGGGQGTVTASAQLTPPTGAVKLWSTKHPQQYRVLAEVVVAGAVVDSINATVGFRTTTFSGVGGGTPPFTLNGHPLHFRGFSHHNSIGGLGVAIPERIQLFRVQASRAMGTNMWRMSHNPYDVALYDLLDATGQMCWDENRDYGAKYGSGVYAVAMRDMVKRDRNHASIIFWSFCNEAECTQFDSNYSGDAFRAAAKSVDPTRPVTANGALSQTPTAQLDVQGGSHWGNSTFATMHARNSSMPMVLSECCSCNSQRDMREMDASCIGDQNSPGLSPDVTGSLGVWTLMDYFGEPAGQPLHAWPHVSCDFGQFDIAGNPKPHAYWYAANWLQGFGATEPGRPPLPYKTVARILELPTAPGAPPPPLRTANKGGGDVISAVTTAPFSELFLDGVSQGVLPTPCNGRGEIQSTVFSVGSAGNNCTGVTSFPVNASGVQCHDLGRSASGDNSPAACARACCAKSSCDTWQIMTGDGAGACWTGVAGEGVGKCGAPRKGTWIGGQRNPGPPSPPNAPYRNATLVALSADPTTHGAAVVLARHSLFAPSANASGYILQLTLDVPSASTGTGSALLLDGRDTAFIRCAIVDSRSNNALVSSAAARVSWRVVSGPGRHAGVSNGNTTSHEWMKSATVDTYLGLARGLVRVTEDCTSAGRESCGAIDVDGGRSPTIVRGPQAACGTSPIVVEVSAAGFAPVTISIPVSVDTDTDGPLEVARATGSNFTSGFRYLDEFVG